MNELNEKLRRMNFGQHAQFIIELRKIAGNGWEYVDDCDPEDIERAYDRVMGHDR